MPRLALVLHGRLGTWSAASSLLQSRTHCTGEKHHYNESLSSFATFAAESLHERVVQPTIRAGVAVSIYLHSWNPEAGALLDQLYTRAAVHTTSLHEPPDTSLWKAASQHLSLRRALQLVSATQHAFSYILISRFDVLFYTDLVLPPLPRDGTQALWLPQQCMPLAGSEKLPEATASCGCTPRESIVKRRPAARCAHSRFIAHGALVGAPTAARHLSAKRASRLGGFNWHGFVLDYFLLATPAIAHGFSSIFNRYEHYVEALRNVSTKSGRTPRRRVLRRQRALSLQSVGDVPLWSHFIWALHINMGVSQEHVHWLPMLHMRDFVLARRFWYGAACDAPVNASMRESFDGMIAERTPPPGAYMVAGRESALSEACPKALRTGARIMCPAESSACTDRAWAARVRTTTRRASRRTAKRGATQGMECFTP